MGFIKYLKTVSGKLLAIGKNQIVEVNKETAEKVVEDIKQINERVLENSTAEENQLTQETPIVSESAHATLEDIVEKHTENKEFSKNFNKTFIRKGEKYLLKGSIKEVPEKLIEEFRQYYKEGRDDTNLIYFWKLLTKNIDGNVVDLLFDYIKSNEISISKYGYIHGLKAVKIVEKRVDTEEDRKFSKSAVMFAQEAIEDIKKKKQSVKNYVCTSSGVLLHKKSKVYASTVESGVLVYSLEEVASYVYEPKVETYYAPFSQGPYGQVIKLGEPVKMPRKFCNPSTDDCAEGLHFGHYRYVSGFSKENGAVLNILVNPMNIVNIPQGQDKIRCCEFYPLSVHVEGKLKENLVNKFSFSEEDYLNYELDALSKDSENKDNYLAYQKMYKDYIKTRVVTI